MHFLTHVLLTYALLQVAAAFQLPFRLPWVSAALGQRSQAPLALTEHAHAPPNRIAVVGAGAGGSAAAFWVGKAKERYGLDVAIDVFDSNSYIGGRSTTVQPYDNASLAPVELGASVFVRANKNLWRATDEFGFERSGFEEGDGTMGIWDGAEFRLETGYSKVGGWWDSLKVLWRYGWRAPRRTRALVDGMVKQFLTLYEPTWGAAPYANLSGLAETFGWADAAAQTTLDYFGAQGIDRKWTVELVEAATRVNYGQNVDDIHALEGMVSLAADNASQVKGGNWQLFEQFVLRAGANVYLNTTVLSITQTSGGGGYTLRTRTAGSASAVERGYRAVVLAAPFHSSSIELALADGAGAPAIPPQPYVRLHVTLLATPSSHPRTRYFKRKDGETVPSMVLTTWEGVREREGGGEPEFNSLSYHGKVRQRDGAPANCSAEGGEAWVVKIFSRRRVEDRWLRRVFGEVGWVHRKEWDAYPMLTPTTAFPPIKLAKGLYYVNAFEPFISTMETETIAARNVVELLMQEEFEAGICKARERGPEGNSDSEDPLPGDFVYGWDC